MDFFDKGAEAKLVERLTDLVDDVEGWTSVVFAFDGLLEEYRSGYQIKIALNMLKDLLRGEEVEAYVFEDSTVALLCFDTPRQMLDKAVFQLRYLFMDDPLAYTPDGEENTRFCDFYDVEAEFNDFSTFARRKMLGNKIGAPEMPEERPIPAAAAKKLGQTSGGGIFKQIKGLKSGFFNANSLVGIERDLRNVDLRPALRRQAVCAAIPEMMVRRVFDEVYINIAHLRETMRLDVDLLSNRWLFKYLTELLDMRMLAIMTEKPDDIEFPLSLNLNVKTLMSDEFAAFDASIKPASKVSIVIELQVSDVFEDMQAFMMARNNVQKLGYRICLDGLTNLSFAQIKRETLGFDLVKLQWNADITSNIDSTENRDIAKLIKACGANRVILTRCDNKQAVDYGQALGVSLFQGRYLDKLMNPSATVEN